MPPDFSKETKSNLGKRAGYICSNPSCRKHTAGPNASQDKATLIGEAAHIYGARPKSKRFRSDMSDAARAEITNGIWLCRNCHKIVDDDEVRFSATVLYQWREEHDQYVFAKLQGIPDLEPYSSKEAILHEFKDYPPIVRRIILDNPDGWHWRLAAELMRHLNTKPLQRLSDLRAGLYTKPTTLVHLQDFSDWFQIRIAEMSNIISPLEGLMDELTNALRADADDDIAISNIHRCCLLMVDFLDRVLFEEEVIAFAEVPLECEKLSKLLRDGVGSQTDKIREIPDRLDSAVALLNTDHGGTEDNPYVFEHIVTLQLPEGWAEQIQHELTKIEKKTTNESETDSSGCASFIVVTLILFLLFLLL